LFRNWGKRKQRNHANKIVFFCLTTFTKTTWAMSNKFQETLRYGMFLNHIWSSV